MKCVRCKCTDDDCSGCIARTGKPCHWVRDGLCSACDFQIAAGVSYRCRDGKTRRIVEIAFSSVFYVRTGKRRYSMSIRRFTAMAVAVAAPEEAAS